MNRRNSISNTGAQGTRSRNAASGNCPGDTARTTGSGRRRKAFFALIASGVIALSGLSVFADDLVNTVPSDENYDTSGTVTTAMPGPGGNSSHPGTDRGNSTTHQTTKVRQSQSTTSATTFASGAPLSTIYIDQARINKPGSDNPQAYIESGGSNITYKLLASDPTFAPGIEYNEGTATVNYNPSKTSGLKQLMPGDPLVMSGPLYELTFKDAAIMPDGTKMHLKVTFSDATIYTDERLKSTNMSPMRYDGSAYLSIGANFRYGGTDTRQLQNNSSTASGQPIYYVNETAKKYGSSFASGAQAEADGGAKRLLLGQRMNATYQVVNDNGIPVEGSFVLAFAGINIDRDPYTGGGNNTAKPAWYVNANNPELDFFSESIGINTAGLASDYIYVRSNNNNLDDTNTPQSGTTPKKARYYPIITENDGVVKITANQYNSSGSMDNASYSTGFITVADSGKGITLTGYGHGSQSHSMQTSPFASKTLWYRYISKTGPHGNIQITSDGNYNKKLTDGGDVLGPGTYVVTEGKTVTYTMTPDTGYKLSTLKLNGTNIKFNTEDINRMKKGDSLTATTAAGRDATLKYETDGTYSLVIPYAEHDESVEVTWEPTTADILYYKTWDDKDDKDGMRVGADGTSDWPEVKLQQSIDGGASWTDVTKDAFGRNLTTSQPVPSGKDTTSGSSTSGEYLDGLYDKQNGTTTHPYTWQYLPVYTYDSSGADRVIQYRIVEGDEPGNNPALTGYKNPKYFDGQSFFLSSEELKSIDGWIVYKDQTTGKYYVSKEDGIDKDDAKYDNTDSDYYEVINWKVQSAKASPQPNKGNLTAVTSSEYKKIGTEQVLRDPNTEKEYVERSGKYHEVFYNSISDVGLTFDPNQGDPDPSTFVNSTMNGYNTADKAIAYQSVGVKNEHTVSDIYVEVLKQWNDANLYNQNTVVANGNQYDRRNITFTLHGTKPNGDVVDLNPGDPSTPDLSITLDRGETDSKTDRQTAGGLDIVKDTTNGKEYVLIGSDYYEVTSEDEDAVTGSYRPKAASVQPDAGNLSPVTGEKANGEQVLEDSTDNKKYVKVTTGTGTSAEEKYHEVVSIDKAAAQGGFAASPASPQPDRSNLTDVYKSTYKIDYNNFGATFYGLQAYKDGQLINYTVTESYNDVDAWSAEGAKLNQASTWTVTGGMLTENGDGSYTMSGLSEIKQNDDLKGYTGKFINTPIVDDEFKQLPVTIKKKDAFTGQPLEGATFTVYTDAFNRDAGSQPTSSFQELDGYTLYKDPSDDKQYVKINGKYHLVTGTKIADEAADPQPTLTNDNRVKNDNYKQINGKDVETDRKGHNYIKEGNKYYEVDSEGNVSSTEANPQPTGTLHKIKTSGAVDQVNVVTDKNGDATINFNQTGTYYIVESSSPDGYEDESDKTYRFTVDKKLMKVTFEEASSSDDHDTSFWKRLYDLIFGNGTTTDTEVWNQVNDRSGTLTLKNTPITANIMTRKVWDDANDQDGVRPTDAEKLPKVELQYTTDDITDDSVTPTWNRAQVYDSQTKQLKDVDIKQFTNAGGAIHADPNNAYTWLNLPAYRNGKVVYYRLVETSPLINDGTYKITKNETVASHDSEFTLVNSNLQSRNQIVEIVNEHKPQTLTINAVKRWNDHSDEDETRPKTLKITLWKTVNNVNTELYSLDLNGEADAQTTAGYYELAPTDNGDTWNAIFKTLPAYENGSPITYYMVETLTDTDKQNYVEEYSISYTDTTGAAVTTKRENKVVAKDVKRTYEEEKFDNKTVYTAGGKRYVKQDDQYYEILKVTTYTTGSAADPQPEASNLTQTGDRTTDTDQVVLVDSTTGTKYIYNSVDVKYYSVVEHVNEYISDTAASQQPTDPEKVYTDTENTDATIKVENTSKNNISTKKYWIGGANANIRFHLFRTTQTGSAIAMETKKTTAEPIATSDSIGGETVYIHANGKRYVRRADPADADKFVYHEINEADDSIATTGIPYTDIEIRTWTPYDLDANGKRQYVKKTDSTVVISEDQYNALETDAEKAQYEVKIKNGWELVDQHLFVSSAFNTSLSLPGDDEPHLFEDLPALDDDGNPYTYRILETTTAGNTEDERFEGHYSENGHTVTNINKKVQSGETNIDVMKDLEGRAWRTEAQGDVFYFYIDPLKQVNENNGTITEFNDSEATDKAEIPIPSDGHQWGRALKQNTAIGSAIREVSFSPIIYELSDVDSSTHTSTYYYKVYESRNTDGDPVYHKDNKGITYDGSLNESTGVWTPKTLIMKVVATADGNGVVTTTHQWAEYKNDGKALEWSSETPAFKNEYSSASDAKLWIEKNISDRAWVPYNNGKGDAYQFTINSISGAPLNMEHTTQDGAYYTMPLVTESTSGNPQEDLQNYDTSSWAFGITGDPIDGSVLDSNGRAEFVYEVFERPSATSDNRDSLGLNNYKVENLEYDESKKYVKVTVQDNWDGTLRFDAQYYSDASCLAKYLIPGNQRWIEDKTEIVYLHNNSQLDPADPNYVGPTSADYKKTAEQYNNLSEENKNKYFLSKVQSKRLLSEEEVASIGEMTSEEIAEAGYRQVHVAHFTNIESDDIVVKKEWVGGPAVEDVSLHLVRHLFDLSEEENLNKTFIDDEEAKYKEETGKNDFWQVISRRYDVSRGDFLNDDGTPKYDSGSTTTSSQTYGDLKDKNGNSITEPDFIENFNSDLPKYVWVTETDSTTGTERNVLKRAVYKLVEDDTSDAYEESYRTSKAGQDDVKGSQYYIDGETLIVTNTVKATNTANIAAVKQLLGRNWIETDEFPFELKAIGAGKYYKKGETGGSEGEFKEPDYSAEAVAKVPMPAVYVKTGSDPEEIITQTRYNELTDEEKAEYTKKSTNSATATSDTTTVDPNGGLERLARFDEIVFTINDLVYNEKSKHYQGDFFYTMTEKLPEIVTTGDNQSYPTAYTYTYKTTEGGKTVNKTETVNITDKSIPSTVPQEGTIRFIEWNNGITYDMTEHTVHIKVRENRTGMLEVQIGYDEETDGTISTGTQFTPVYTNKYSAETEVAVSVEKRIMGRKWKTSDKFDFIMNPLGGAPFTDADKTEFPEGEGEDDGSDSDVQAALNAHKAAHTERGAHIKRMTIDAEAAQGSDPQTMTMPKLLFKYSDLNQVVGDALDKNGDPVELYYGNDDSDEDNKVPDGTSFGQFIYAFEEHKYKNITPDIADLERDPDTEYARITVIDKRDGTLDYYIEIFEDRYCTKPRTKPGTDEPTDKVTFVNQLKRDLSVTKAWADPAISNVTLRLEWAVIDKDATDDTLHWQPVDETTQVPGITGRTEWLNNVDGSKTISKDATGSDLTVTWTNLPAYADIKRHDDRTGESGDDNDLNDLWIYYRVVEEPVANVDTRYNETAYAEGDTLDTKVKKDGVDVDKYQTDAYGANPFHTGPEKVGGDWVAEKDRVKNLYVTNFPKDLDDKVDFGVVKQYIGKVWTNEEFTFKVEPVKAKRGDETDYTRHDTSTTVYINNEDPEDVLTEEEYEALTDPDKADKYTPKTTTYRMPTDISSNTAVASKTSPEVSDNEHAANFKGLTIKMSDLKRVPNDTTNSDLVKYRGKDYGEFIYKITEVLPPDAEATTEVCGEDEKGIPLYYTVATDSKGNKINYTTEEHFVKIIAVSDGNEIDFTVSYDGRDAGQFVPVFTNYALMPTPIEGTKTWIGGKTEDHVNGSVVLDDNKKNILEGEGTDKTEDKRNLKLYRKSAEEGSSAEPVTKDDAGNPLAIVWVKAKRTPVTTEEYVETVDTSVKSGKTYYRDGDGEYIVVTPEEGANPSDEGWYEKISVTRYESEYEKQETGNGTYTIKAKVSKTEGGITTVSYEDPYLNLLDEDGYEYTYSVVEESVPNGYEETYKGLHVTNTYNVKDTIKVTKTWDDAQGKSGLRPESVIVHLYKIVDDSLTDAEKKAIIEKLNPADYPGKDVWTYGEGEYESEEAAQAAADTDQGVEEGQGDYSTIEHVVMDADQHYQSAKDAAISEAQAAKTDATDNPVQVEVAKKVIEPATGEKDEWTTGITWKDLPVYDENGDIIKYVVTEESVTGYTTTYKLRDGEYKEEGNDALVIELDDDADAETIDVKNSLTPATDEVKVEKVWNDNDNAQGKRPASVTLELYKYVYDKNTDAYDKTEKKVTTRPATAADVEAAKAKDPQSTLKVGDDITVPDLVLDGKKDTENLINYEEAAWKGIWKNLPRTENGKTVLYTVNEVTTDRNVYDAPGTKGKYTDNPCISGDQVNGYKVTNTYTPDTTTAMVTKKWADNQNALNSRPDKLTMTLMRKYEGADGQPVHELAKDINGGDIKDKISADDEDPDPETWVYRVKDLPKYTKVVVDGTDVSKEYTYYWKETVPAGYTATVLPGADTSGAAAETGKQTVDNNKIITNTSITGTLTVTKTWNDAKNSDGVRPSADEFIDKVTLYAGNTKITDFGDEPKVKREIKPSSGTTGTGDNQNIYTITYSNLPVLDKNGAQISYSIKEDAIDEYTIDVAPTATTLSNTAAQGEPAVYTGGINLTNKHDYETTDIEITKNWIDQDGFKHEKVDAFKSKLELYADGTKVTDPALLNTLQMTPASDGETADKFIAKWTGLPKYKNVNNKLVEIVYTVKENGTVSGYAEPVYNNKASLGTTRTQKNDNTQAYNGGEINNIQLITVDVEKTWDDNSDHDNQRPEEIKIEFFRNGIPLTTEFGGPEVTLKKDEPQNAAAGGKFTNADNKYTWTKVLINLPYADANGVPYNYTAVETEAKKGDHWYSAFVGDQTMRQILLSDWNNDKNTLTYRLTNSDADDTVSFTVDKIWNDSSDVDKLRPQTITYKLYQQPEGGEKTQITALPTGADIHYMNGTNIGTAITMANNGNIVVNTNKTDTTQGTQGRIIIRGLPKYAAGGKEITYTIVEDAVRGYNLNDEGVAQNVDGAGDQTSGITVTNVHTPVSTSVTPQAIKAITGRNFKLEGETFRFLIEPQGGAPRPAKDYATVTAGLIDGKSKIFDLPEFTFTGADMAEKLATGDTKTFTYTLTEVNGGSTIDDLKYDNSTLTLKITVTRKADGGLEIKEYDPATTDVNESGVVWGTNNKDADRTFTNEHGAKVDLTLRKVWVDDDADDTVLDARPAKATLKITATTSVATDSLETAGFTKVSDTSYTRNVDLTDDNKTPSESNTTWQDDVENLPKYDADGKDITYSVTEDRVPNYKDPEYAVKGNLYTVTNVYERDTFTGTKVWHDGGKKHDNTKEVKLTVHRQAYDASDNPVGSAETVSGAHIHWEGNEFTITGLPGQDGNRNTYTYWVSEAKVNGYKAPAYSVKTHTTGTAVDGIESGGTITNASSASLEVDLYKEWAGDNDNADNTRKATKINLYQKAEGKSGYSTEWGNKIQEIEVSVTADTSDPLYRWSAGGIGDGDALPAYDDEGNKYIYTFGEHGDNQDLYTPSVQFMGKHTETKAGDTSTSFSIDDAANEDFALFFVTFTNRLTQVYDDIKVEKIWDDEDDADGLRPDKVTVHLYKEKEVTLTDDEIDAVTSDVNQAVFDTDGIDGLSEEERQAYLDEVQDALDKALADKKKAESPVQVEVVKKEISKQSGDSDDEWTTGIEWKDLPVYNEDGTKIKYVVIEEDVNGYKTTYKTSGSDYTDDGNLVELDTADGAQTVSVKNTHKPEALTLEGTKTWKEDPAGTTHVNKDEVKLTLTRQLEGAAQPEAITRDDAGNDIAFIWSDEDGDEDNFDEAYVIMAKNPDYEEGGTEPEFIDAKFNKYKEGKAYTYKVEETAIEGYATTYTDNGDLTQGNITNTRGAVASAPKFDKIYIDKSITKIYGDTEDGDKIKNKGDIFEFELTGKEVDYAGSSSTIDASGMGTVEGECEDTAIGVTTDAIAFNKVGKYAFELSEKAGAQRGVTYDTTKFVLLATVSDPDKNGDLKVEWTTEMKSTDGGRTWNRTNKAEFKNEYRDLETSTVPEITKVLENHKLDSTYKFEFVLYGGPNDVATTGLDADEKLTGKTTSKALDSETNKATEVVKLNNDNGQGKLTFTLDDLKKLDGTYADERTFTYLVYEKGGNVGGVTYDSEIKELSVKLEYVAAAAQDDPATTDVDESKEHLKVTYIPAGQTGEGKANTGLVFTNKYDPDAATTSVTDGGDTTVQGGTVDITKRLSVPAGQKRNMLKDEFLFELLDKNGKRVALGTNKTEGQTVTGDDNDSQSAVSMATITLTSDMVDEWKTDDDEGKVTGTPGAKYGELTYTIKEIAGNNTDDLIYDTHPATVKAILIDNESGDLQIKWVLADGQDETFTNTVPTETVDKPVRLSWVNDTDMDDTTGTDRNNDGINVSKERPDEVTVTLQQKKTVYEYGGKEYDTLKEAQDAADDAQGANPGEGVYSEIKPVDKWVDVTKNADGKPVDSSITLDPSKNIDGDPNNWGDTTTWTGLPLRDENGDQIEYRIIESGYKIGNKEVGPKKATTGGETGIDGEEVKGGSTLPVGIPGYSFARTPVNLLGGNLVTLVNKYETTTITGTKTWIDPDPDKHNNSAEIEFTVKRQDPDDPSKWTTLNEGKDYHVDWTNDGGKDKTFNIIGLTKYVDANATKPVDYQYKVTENAVAGYTTTYPNTTDSEIGYLTNEGGEIKNTIEQAYVEIPVEKVWVGTPTGDVTVQLKKGSDVLDTKVFSGAGTHTFTRDNGDGKDKGYEKYDLTTGAEIQYTVDEVVPADAEFTKTITGNMTDGFVVTNTSVKTTTIYAQKQWAGDNDASARDGRGDVQFKLVQTIDGAKKDVADYTTDVDGESKEIKGTQTIKADKTAAVNTDAGTVNWPNLPQHDADGNTITYTVEEISAPEGYTAGDVTGEGTKDKPFVIKNTLNDATVDVPVRIVWDDKKDQEGERPDSVVVRVQVKDGDEWTEVYVKDGKLVDESTDGATKVDDATLSNDNNWKKLFKDLPANDANGKPLEYRVVEMDGDTVVDGDTEKDLPGKSGTVDYTAGITGNQNNGFVITNTYLPGTVSVTVIKHWDKDANVKQDTRKDVNLILIGHVSNDPKNQIGYIGKTKRIKVNMDADEEADAGSVTWSGLPKKIDGQELIWTVLEDSVPGYYVSDINQTKGEGGKTENGEAEFELTNEYIGSVSTVTATKIWEDGNNRDGKRDDVWFQLYRKIGDSAEEKVGEPVKVVVNKTTADGTEAGEVTWDKLPDIIAETKDTGTTEDVYEEVDPAPAGVSPKTEGWYEADGSDSYKLSEDETVQEGKTYYTKTTEQVKTEMPERSVVYWVKEVNKDGDEAAPDGYTSTVVQTEPGVFKATNIHEPATTDVNVKVVWSDNEDADGVRPDHVVVKLKDDQGNEQVAKAKITYKDTDAGWVEAVYTFDNLPKYKDGEEIKYTVVELDKDESTECGNGTTAFDDNYSVAIIGDGSSENPYVITNTHNSDSVNVKVVKEWEGDDGHEAETRKDVKVRLIQVAGGARKEVKEPMTLTFDESNPEAEMSASWEGLPTVVKGEDVTYEVKEDDVEEYTMTSNKVETDDDGNYTVTITNTYGHVASHDVIYVDPKNPDGEMIVQSSKYSPKEAEKQAQGKLSPPADPSHSGTKFIGWAVNFDENDNWVLVAKYQDDPVKPTPTVSYIDPQSGKPVIISKQTNNPGSIKPPAAPKHKNMSFVKWLKVKDAAGNTMYIAQYACDCSNGSGGNGSGGTKYAGSGDPNDPSAKTGEHADVILWIILIITSILIMATMYTMRRREDQRL